MFKKFVSKAKNFYKSSMGKAHAVGTLAGAAMFASLSKADASTGGTADTATVDSMTTAFADVKATGLAALAAVAVIGISLFAGIYAWKYGKKVFSVIAK